MNVKGEWMLILLTAFNTNIMLLKSKCDREFKLTSGRISLRLHQRTNVCLLIVMPNPWMYKKTFKVYLSAHVVRLQLCGPSHPAVLHTEEHLPHYFVIPFRGKASCNRTFLFSLSDRRGSLTRETLPVH